MLNLSNHAKRKTRQLLKQNAGLNGFLATGTLVFRVGIINHHLITIEFSVVIGWIIVVSKALGKQNFFRLWLFVQGSQ